jgi:hypothetical protein
VIAARILRAVIPPSGSQPEKMTVCLHHGPGPLAEPERRREEDVSGRAALYEVLRELEPARAALSIEHPFRRRPAMVHVPCVDIRPCAKKQIYDRARVCEMESGLSVAAALVDALRIVSDQAGQQVGAIEMRSCAGVDDGAAGDESFGCCSRGYVQPVESASPPVAAPVWVGSKLEQDIDYRGVVGVRDDRRRVKGEHRFVEPPSKIGMLTQKASDGAGVVPTKGVMEAFLGRGALVRHSQSLQLKLWRGALAPPPQAF